MGLNKYIFKLRANQLVYLHQASFNPVKVNARYCLGVKTGWPKLKFNHEGKLFKTNSPSVFF